MDGTWTVYWEDKPVGTCRMEQQGLYCRIRCRCSRISDEIWRLLFCGNGETLDLGILVPVDGGFGLDRKLPLKNLPSGEPAFLISRQQHMEDGKFIPVHSDKPFEYLSKIANMRFCRRNGEAGVLLK